MRFPASWVEVTTATQLASGMRLNASVQANISTSHSCSVSTHPGEAGVWEQSARASHAQKRERLMFQCLGTQRGNLL